jgi:hypothetical protein
VPPAECSSSRPRELATIAAAEEALANDGYLIDGLHGPKAHSAAIAKNARGLEVSGRTHVTASTAPSVHSRKRCESSDGT